MFPPNLVEGRDLLISKEDYLKAIAETGSCRRRRVIFATLAHWISVTTPVVGNVGCAQGVGGKHKKWIRDEPAERLAVAA